MTEPRGSRDDRQLKNFLINPNRQFRLVFFAVVLGLGSLLLFFAFQIWVFSTMIVNIAPMLPPASGIEQMLSESIHWSWIGFGAGALFFSGLVTFTILLVSHRIYGPMVAIRKHLAAMARGEYDYRTHLRKNDEFKEVAEDLNRLSETLQGKAT